jgi:hypothetical protein
MNRRRTLKQIMIKMACLISGDELRKRAVFDLPWVEDRMMTTSRLRARAVRHMQSALPGGVEPSFDGMTLEVP